MKLEMTLPEEPGLLHAVPVLNLFALLIFIFLLGPSLVLQSGVAVELPPSRFQMQRYEDSLVITLGPGEPLAPIYLGRDSMSSLSELSARLDALRDSGATAKSIVLLQSDINTPVGVEREVTEQVLSKGFRLAMVGKSAAEISNISPSPTPRKRRWDSTSPIWGAHPTISFSIAHGRWRSSSERFPSCNVSATQMVVVTISRN